jgi:hypothetical protein
MSAKIRNRRRPGCRLFAQALSAALILAPAACRKGDSDFAAPLAVEVSVDEMRPRPGESVQASVWIKNGAAEDEATLAATLFVPGQGPRDLALSRAGTELRLFQTRIPVAEDSPPGLYVVTVRASRNGRSAVGKASFIVGKIVGDFMITSAVPVAGGAVDTAAYMARFREAGGNFVILHDIITKKAWYPSRVASRTATPGSSEDRLSAALDAADRLGLSCLITVVWDMTRPMPYADYEASQKAVLGDLWSLYGAHPSLAGFYDYQEGSGTYFVAHVRSFADRVKALNKGLLAGCAPYIDDPLLAGYLAAIDSLDVLIYQGAYEASWRPDNRKCFPVRRTRDFAALSAGAALQKGKIALSHVELFGYLEKRFAGQYLATPQDALDQILSAATCFGPDGLTLFTYHYNIHLLGKKIADVAKVEAAVKRGLEAYRAIAPAAAGASSHIALYVPYSDWWTGRWAQSYEPALDAFRRLGVAADIVPFVPPRREEILPFYPYHLNEEQVAYLLDRKYVLVLPDVAGMQDTDSALLKTFVERGGNVLLYGPRIPYGDLFDREALTGGTEEPAKRHLTIEVLEPMYVRVRRTTMSKAPAAAASGWKSSGGRAAAVFEDGTAAVLVNNVGKGQVITIPLSLADLASAMPYFSRDILDHALARAGVKRPFDVLGADTAMDFSMSEEGGVLTFAAANSGEKSADLRVNPLDLRPGVSYTVTDLVSKKSRTVRGRDLIQFSLRLKPHDFAALEIRPKIGL